jgi:antitoxin component of RelBE/YafQ-DinJ toxin-antitoxin module
LKVKKNISLDDSLVRNAENKAKQMGFNFSAYITYLINKDISEASESVITVENNSNIKNKKVSSAIDEILG